MSKSLTKDELRYWMNYYHDKWIELHNKYEVRSIKVTPKMKEAEVYVDKYIAENGRPPTYRKVQKELNLKSACASYARLRHCRDKMTKYK